MKAAGQSDGDWRVKEDDQLLGACGLGAWDREAAQAEIGYELARAYWGQGLMPEALQAIVRFGFETMGLQRIVAEVMLDNTSSCRLLNKVGFQTEGILEKRGFWKGEYHDLRLFTLTCYAGRC
jgi:ribosomal-protein-alanine N-acetyltransferase